MRYFIELAYQGSDFHGSQSQPNGITVQQTMETAMATILRVPVALTLAGRTDAGVHAEQMYAHLDTDQALPDNLAARLNNLLPPTIAVRRIFPVADDMHARFSASARTYEYRVTWVKDPFTKGAFTRVAPGLDLARMNDAAQQLIGRHDCAAFCKVHTDVKTTFCTITEAHWQAINDHQAIFTITADRFLRNMVRAVVGTLLEVGYGRMDAQGFSDVMASHNRCAAGQSAPAEGLYLVKITYTDI